MRSFADHIPKAAARELAVLTDRRTSSKRYQEAMNRLGTFLAQAIRVDAPTAKTALLICTAEDADFLAQGLLAELSLSLADLKLACFWNLRSSPLGVDLDVAPIIRRYEEPSKAKLDLVIVVKSVIATGCVVRHNIMDVVDRKQPKRILVVSPVMRAGTDVALRAEFPRRIADRMKFIYFAIDDKLDSNGYLDPGIGGSVYKRLGIGDSASGLTPELVRRRRDVPTASLHDTPVLA
jgi:uracil phosphoribosyltransferase